MHKLSGKQCKMARSLLKWNIYDLANHVKGILPKRIDSFEHSMVHLIEWENDEMVRAFKKQGILFKSDMDVALHKVEQTQDVQTAGMTEEGAHIRLDADQNVLSDSSAEKTAGVDAPLTPEEKRRAEAENTQPTR